MTSPLLPRENPCHVLSTVSAEAEEYGEVAVPRLLRVGGREGGEGRERVGGGEGKKGGREGREGRKGIQQLMAPPPLLVSWNPAEYQKFA